MQHLINCVPVNIFTRFLPTHILLVDFGCVDSDITLIFSVVSDVKDNNFKAIHNESIFVPHDVYVTTNPKNIKSTDAVTYDDEGNIIL